MKIFAIGKPNKKADLSLSINAIVIVVLAMTLLGLGLGFIRNIFKGLEEQRSEISEQVKAQILEDLRTGNKKLSFPATEITMEQNSAKVVALGVKNTKANQELNFAINVTVLQAKSGNVVASDIEFFYDTTPKTLKVTESDVYSLRITPRKADVFMVKLAIIDLSDSSTYAEKTFFLNVG